MSSYGGITKMDSLERLFTEAKALIMSGEIAEEINEIKNECDILYEQEVIPTLGHVFSRGDFMKFEQAVEVSMEDKTDSFKTYIEWLLIKKNLTKRVVSVRCGIEESTLNRYINGSRKLNVNVVFRIALALRLNLVETETLLRKANMGFKKAPKDAVIIEAIKQENFDYLAIEAVLRALTDGEESILTDKEKKFFSDEDWEIQLID